MHWITDTTSPRCSPFPPKSTARARCRGTRSATARRSPNSTAPRSTGEPDNVTRQMVYRIAADGAIQDRFEVALQTGSPVTNEASPPSMAGSRGSRHRQSCSSIELINRDESRSDAELSGGRQCHARRCWAFITRGARSVLVLAIMAWRRSRSFGLPKREQVAWAVFVLLFGSARVRGLSALSSLADPTALSELPRPGSPRPCRLRGVRNALPGSVPQRNRDLRLKRMAENAEVTSVNRCSLVDTHW